MLLMGCCWLFGLNLLRKVGIFMILNALCVIIHVMVLGSRIRILILLTEQLILSMKRIFSSFLLFILFTIFYYNVYLKNLYIFLLSIFLRIMLKFQKLNKSSLRRINWHFVVYCHFYDFRKYFMLIFIKSFHFKKYFQFGVPNLTPACFLFLRFGLRRSLFLSALLGSFF